MDRAASCLAKGSTRGWIRSRIADAMTKPKTTTKMSKAAMMARAFALRQEAEDIEAKLAGKSEGRPTGFRNEFIRRVTPMCLLGLTNEEVADRLGISSEAFDKYARDIPEFAHAIWEGREGADEAVAGALISLAKGYTHEEDDIRTVSLGANAGSEIVITKTVKHYPPHDGAIGRWMRAKQNRRFPNPTADAALGGLTPGDLAQRARAAIRAALATTDEGEPDAIRKESAASSPEGQEHSPEAGSAGEGQH